MKTQFQSVSNLKALARAVALMAAWLLITDIDLKDTLASSSFNIDNGLAVVAASADNDAIPMSGSLWVQSTPPPSEIHGSVTPGDGSDPTLVPHCQTFALYGYYDKGSSPGFGIGSYPWGQVAVGPLGGGSPGHPITYQFYAAGCNYFFLH